MKTRYLAVLALALAPRAASADVVEPPPSYCPPGKTPTTSHGGPRCVLDAPSDCPPGWHGVLGGECVLHVCTEDSQCPAQRCVATSLCYEQRLRRWGERGPDGPAHHGPELAGPPYELETPVPYEEVVGLCGGAQTCGGTAECKPGKVCLPPGVAAPTPRPPDAEGADGARYKHGGCAGCMLSPASSAVPVGLALALGLLGIARRRR